MDTPEIIHNRLKKRFYQIMKDEREYAVLKLRRTLNNIQLPPGFPEGSQLVLEELMASTLETSNTSLMAYTDAILTAVAEEMAFEARRRKDS